MHVCSLAGSSPFAVALPPGALHRTTKPKTRKFFKNRHVAQAAEIGMNANDHVEGLREVVQQVNEGAQVRPPGFHEVDRHCYDGPHAVHASSNSRGNARNPPAARGPTRHPLTTPTTHPPPTSHHPNPTHHPPPHTHPHTHHHRQPTINNHHHRQPTILPTPATHPTSNAQHPTPTSGGPLFRRHFAPPRQTGLASSPPPPPPPPCTPATECPQPTEYPVKDPRAQPTLCVETNMPPSASVKQPYTPDFPFPLAHNKILIYFFISYTYMYRLKYVMFFIIVLFPHHRRNIVWHLHFSFSFLPHHQRKHCEIYIHISDFLHPTPVPSPKT